MLLHATRRAHDARAVRDSGGLEMLHRCLGVEEAGGSGGCEEGAATEGGRERDAGRRQGRSLPQRGTGGRGSLSWAMDLVSTRAYGLVQDCCGGAADGANGGGAAAPAAAPGAARQVASTLSERVARGDASVVQVVCPVLDLFNHRAGSRTRVELQRDAITDEPQATNPSQPPDHAPALNYTLKHLFTTA